MSPLFLAYFLRFCSVAIGRSVATLAELSFIAQWALLIEEFSEAARMASGVKIARMLVPLIGLAEVFTSILDGITDLYARTVHVYAG